MLNLPYLLFLEEILQFSIANAKNEAEQMSALSATMNVYKVLESGLCSILFLYMHIHKRVHICVYA